MKKQKYVYIFVYYSVFYTADKDCTQAEELMVAVNCTRWSESLCLNALNTVHFFGDFRTVYLESVRIPSNAPSKCFDDICGGALSWLQVYIWDSPVSLWQSKS